MKKLNRHQIRYLISEHVNKLDESLLPDLALLSYYYYLKEQQGDTQLAENLIIAVLLLRTALKIYGFVIGVPIMEQVQNYDRQLSPGIIDKNELIAAYRRLSQDEIHAVVSLLSSKDPLLKYKIDLDKIINVSDEELHFIIDNFDLEYGLSLV
tara:strand:+ start:143 stop:601 length:459 start_codon:yes stop_codon:yes gene_type:complete